MIHGRQGVLGGGDDIQVAHGLFAAAEAAGNRKLMNRLEAFEILIELQSIGFRLGVEEPLALFFVEDDPFEDLLLGFDIKARKFTDPVLLGGLFEIFQGTDAELFVEDSRPFGSDPFDLEQVQDMRGELLFDRFELGQLPGGDDFGDLFGDPLPDIGKLGEVVSLFDQFGEVVAAGLDGPGGVAVSPDAERVVPLQFQIVGKGFEKGSDLTVAHRRLLLKSLSHILQYIIMPQYVKYEKEGSSKLYLLI